MKKLFLGVAIASALGLTACSEDSYNELANKAETLTPMSHIAFDPGNADPAKRVLPTPNDLLFSGTLDGTINIPGEEADGSSDYTDPQLALGALDGWSTTSPISIGVEPATDNEGNVLTIDAESVFQPGAVRMFEATVGGPLSGDAECQQAPSASACKVGDELQFGVDFVSQAVGNNIVIVPLKPLKAKQSYIYLTTDLIKDSAGQSIAASATYNSVSMDIDTLPLETEAQLSLQTLVNSYEKGVAAAHGVNLDEVSFSGLFTTQSISDVYETTKLLMVDTTTGNPYAPQLSMTPTPTGITVAQAAGLSASDGLAYTLADLADIYSAEITVPVYGDCNSVACSGIDGRWSAQGDSPVSVLLALQAGTLSQSSYGMQAIANGIADPSVGLTNPSLLAGKTWLLDDGTPADKTKHLTKFNPIPQIKGYETVPVLITLPNAAKLAAFNTLQGTTFVPPTNGWPTNIALHGLGGTKEMVLAYAGAYASAGIATIAIDMPLHGARSFDANNDGVFEVSATDPRFGAAYANGDPLAFVNVASSLSVRDNFRQATLDHLALRAVLTGLYMGIDAAGGTQVFDINQITAQGLSLGAIVGSTFANYASTGLTNPFTGEQELNAYAINSVSLVAPTGGLAGSFAGSAAFGPELSDTIIASPEFAAALAAVNTAGLMPGDAGYEELAAQVYASFLPAFALAVQTAVDSADPINHAQALSETQLPIHLIEIVGDMAGNLPDQVLPNSVVGFPLSGTEPVIANIGLDCVYTTALGSGAVRFSKGHHSSIVSPAEIDGVTDGSAAQATAEMQQQVVAFAQTANAGMATVNVTNTDVLQACGG